MGSSIRFRDRCIRIGQDVTRRRAASTYACFAFFFCSRASCSKRSSSLRFLAAASGSRSVRAAVRAALDLVVRTGRGSTSSAFGGRARGAFFTGLALISGVSDLDAAVTPSSCRDARSSVDRTKTSVSKIGDVARLRWNIATSFRDTSTSEDRAHLDSLRFALDELSHSLSAETCLQMSMRRRKTRATSI